MPQNTFSINMDAFSDGQVGSKLWLINEAKIQPELQRDFANIAILGSWYGVLPFLLLSQNAMKPKALQLFDVDPAALDLSKKFLDYWLFNQLLKISFKAEDCCKAFSLDLPVDLVINTSAEHMINSNWWNQIPAGCTYIVQSTNMKHPEHINLTHSADDLASRCPSKNAPFYKGEKKFEYADFSFTRHMIMGIK